MSLMKSINTGLSGLNANTRGLGVVGDNIANANTVGFKSSRANFADMLAGKEKSMGANVGAVPDEVLPALYWYAANLGEWSRHAGPRQAMLYRERVRIAMEVIQRRLPNYDNAGADRFLGIYHSRFPASGGDPKRSEEAFKQSLELSPNYFDTRFRYALHYAVLVQEREIFERQLRRVLETPATVVPELEPENKLAQEHARRLMAKADQLFF